MTRATLARQELAPDFGHRSRPKEEASHDTGVGGEPQLGATCFMWVIPFDPWGQPKKEP